MTQRTSTYATNAQAVDIISSGTLSCTFNQIPVGYDVLVYRLSITGPAGTICKVHVGNVVDNATYRSISYLGQNDDADYPEGLLVSGADQLMLAWYTVNSPASFATPAPITGSAAGIVFGTCEYEKAV